MLSEDPTAGREQWRDFLRTEKSMVETLRLREGVTLTLSRIGTEAAREYLYREPEDVFAIGFHLQGGTAFDMEGNKWETRPFDVWAGAAPKTTESTFILPAAGLRAISLRFHPAVATELMNEHGWGTSSLAGLARSAHHDVGVERLPALDHSMRTLAESMFDTQYCGGARMLFLESCSLGLLAAQMQATMTPATSPNMQATRVRKQMEVARDYLDAHLAQPPTIAQLARIVGINECTLKKAFKQMHGITIFGYVQRNRMTDAAAKLRNGLSIDQTASLTGYECPRCFAIAFQRHFGVLPSVFSGRRSKVIPDYHG